MDEFQNRMEIVYIVAELSLQSRMEISYTIYAPVFLEGVSTTETASDAYIVVHGYAPSTTITDGEGFLFVEEFHLSGVSSTTSGGEGFLTTSSRMLVIAVTETTGDGLFESVFAVSLQSVSSTESASNGYVFLQHNLSGPAQTASVGSGELTVDKVYFRGHSVTVTAGDAFMTPRYTWPQGVSTTDVVGEGRITPRYAWTGGTSATETDGIGHLFTDVFFGGASTTESDGQGDFLAPYPVNVTGWSETTSGGDGHLSVLVIMRGDSFAWTYGYSFLHTWVYLGPGPEELIPPSVTETVGFGRFIAPYPRPMDGSSLTVTHGEGRITEAKFLAGTSATETDGTGELSILRALMGASVTLTDGSASAPLVWVLMRGLSFTRTDGDAEIDVGKPTGELVEAQFMVRRLPDTYNKEQESRITRLFRLVGQQVTELQRTLRTTERQRDIDQARGATLDAIGRNVSQGRGGLSDAAYRVMIKAKIARNLSPGDVDGIKHTVASMLNIQTDDVGVRQMWLATPPEPAAVEVHAPLHALGRFGLSPEQFAALVQRIVAAGVRVSTMLEGTFAYSDVPPFIEIDFDPQVAHPDPVVFADHIVDPGRFVDPEWLFYPEGGIEQWYHYVFGIPIYTWGPAETDSERGYSDEEQITGGYYGAWFDDPGMPELPWD